MPQMVKTFLKPLRERRSHRTKVTELVVSPADAGPQSFHAWLSVHPRAERLRDLSSRSRRIVEGLKKWPLNWLKKTGGAVVCYERADGRIRRERGGRPDGAFLRGVVKTVELPTATANASDHYVVLSPKKEPRFMTVEEVMRAYGIPTGSDLWKSLLVPKGAYLGPYEMKSEKRNGEKEMISLANLPHCTGMYRPWPSASGIACKHLWGK